ncbi:MAG TPA: GntR family transcriptional regulator [Polyangiaceae bacterium]|jgi:GntR family transcriptional regulator|nr:GntR family transcriptional regulator [Polyangiaceae bacterium]
MDALDALPLYARVESELAADIGAGRFARDGQLPPEDALSERFAVSRTTVRQAIQRLIQRGLVEIRRGKGTFVSQPKLTQPLTALTGFVEDMTRAGRAPRARVLDKRVVVANEAVARNLRLAKGTRVARIRRVRLADESPVSFDETYLPLPLGEKVMSANLESEAIFALLETRYGVPLIEAEYALEAIAAPARIAAAIEVPVGSPIFLIERTSFSTGRVPVDHEKLYYRGDRIRFVTTLPRRARR